MHIDTPPDLALTARAGLPDALRVLRDAYPRETWEAHGNFGEIVRFWLDRHAMFRELTGRIASETESFLDGGSGFERFAPTLSHLGGFFLNQLHGHHQIEDMHYFPRLVGLDPRIDAGFGILETDHDTIDGMLQDFATAANGVLGADPAQARDAAGAFQKALSGFAPLLERHLTDEEDLVVPVILKSGFQG